MRLSKGDIVQITNGGNEWYPCLLIVDEVKAWGIQGYVTTPKSGDAYYRVKNGEFKKVGSAMIFANDGGMK